MKRYLIFLLSGCATMLLAQPNRCTQYTVTGTYALAYQGYLMMSSPGSSQPVPVPAAGLALVSIDTRGTVTGFAYQSVGGQISQSIMPGTIKLNSDCTGTVDWGGGLLGNLVVLGEGSEIRSVMTAAGAMGNPVISGQWKRISRTPNTDVANQCSSSDMVGVYAIRQSGTLMVPQAGQTIPVPVATLAVGSVDSDGAGPANGVGSIGGQTVPFVVPSAKFERKADCTIFTSFHLTAQGATLGVAAGWGIVLDGGNEIWTIATEDSGGLPIILGFWKRLSPLPAR